jgi:transposase
VAGDRRGDDEGAARPREDRPQPHRQSKKRAKRSLLCEGKGIPVGIEHDGANLNDHKLARATLASIPIARPTPTPEQPQGLCLDKAYDNREVRELLAEFGFTAHIRSRGEEKKQLAREAGFRARRWVVERTHSWLNSERWFRELTEKAIRRGVFHSVPELITAIDDFLQAHNNDPKPFIWTASIDSILEKIGRCKAVLETVHKQSSRP